MPPHAHNYPPEVVAKLMIKLSKTATRKPVVVFVATWAGRQCYVRIAFTDWAYLRLSDLSYAMPYAKCLLVVLEGHGKETEELLHQAFHEERYWGTWFVASAYLIGFIERLRSGVDADQPMDIRLARYINNRPHDDQNRKAPDLAMAETLIRAARHASKSQEDPK